MKKKTLGRFAAVGLAGLTALPSFVMSASALTISQGNIASGDVYKVVTTTATGTTTVYYQNFVSGATAVNVVTEFGANVKLYINNGIVSTVKSDGATEVTTSSDAVTPGTDSGSTTTPTYTTPAPAYQTASDKVYYSILTWMYYPNLSALQSVEGSHTYYSYTTPSVPYSATNCYFNPHTGTYSSNSSAADSYKVTGSASTTTDETAVYLVNGLYYASYTTAYNAANKDTSKIKYIRDYTTRPSNYFSQTTGLFYTTYQLALTASNNNTARVIVFNNAPTYGNYYDYLYGYIYNGGYGFNYNDPYYYYWLNTYGGGSSSSKDTTTAAVGNRKGWTSIASYLQKANTGSSVTVDMNEETTIPDSVMSAIKGRNIDVTFVLENGVTYAVNGRDVTTAKDVEITTKYNTKNISSSLVKAACKKNSAVSSAQVSIDEGSLGFTADVTVKFAAKRAGYSAKLYRYNPSRNSLVLVDTATVKSTGKCTFNNVTKGGDFVIVLY